MRSFVGGLVTLFSRSSPPAFAVIHGNHPACFYYYFYRSNDREIDINFLSFTDYDPHPLLPANPRKESIPQIIRGYFLQISEDL